MNAQGMDDGNDHEEGAQRRRDLSAIAHLVHATRPDWDPPGINAALRNDHRPTPVLALIALHTATDRTARTPAAITHRALPAPTTARSGDHGNTPPHPSELCEQHQRDPQTCPYCPGGRMHTPASDTP